MVEAAGVEPAAHRTYINYFRLFQWPTYNMPTTIPRSRVPLELKRKREKAAQAPGRDRTIGGR
jgi:hypothetical protein